MQLGGDCLGRRGFRYRDLPVDIKQMWKASLRAAAQATLRRLVSFSWSRQALNSVYLMLSPSLRIRFHREFSRLFRDSSVRLGVEAGWRVSFAGRTVSMPLGSQNLWQEWDSAVSIIANDMEVKQTYERFLTSGQPPDLFVDVGANYGTHSLLFLACGTETLTFEPNAACHDYFMRACSLNEFTPHLLGVALGSEHGHISLSYPPKDTWNGSTSSDAIAKLEARDLVTVQVELRTLDDYLDQFGQATRMLVKIDTEGNELSVLEGARTTLSRYKPIVIFESLTSDQNRPALYELLASFGYKLGELPVGRLDEIRGLTREGFVVSQSTNYVAAA